MKLSERVKYLMEQKNLSQEDLARRTGVSQSSIHKVLSGKTKKPGFIVDLASALGVTAESLLNDASYQESPETAKPPAISPHGFSEDEYNVRSFSKKIPLFGFASATNERESFNPAVDIPLEWIDDSLRLGHIPGLYALMIMGDSMEPRYFHGEIVFVNPRKPPGLNEDCVVLLADGVAHIKRLLRTTRTDYIFHQYNPVREITVKRADVKGLFSIAGRT